MKEYMIEYKDWSDFGCGERWSGKDEKEAITNCQKELIKRGDLMTRLVEVYEVEDEIDEKEEDAKWSIKGGPVLEQEHQDTLNDAMNSLVNKDGLTLREAIELKSKNE